MFQKVVTLTFWDSVKTMKLRFWDEEQNRMVTFKQFRQMRKARATAS
jgi:hypothetical protein